MKKEDYYTSFCQELKKQHRFRTLTSSNQDNLVDFSHNDYLGLHSCEEIREGGVFCAQKWGTGSRASRLLAGNLAPHQKLEEAIACNKNKQKALFFSSGYQTNISVLSALLDKKVLKQEPLVFSDRLNHASIHHACFLSQVSQIRYLHLDMNHLESLLDKYKDSSQPKFIITETLFGMDGDVVDMDHLTQLAKHYSAFLYVDEAHAMGILGEKGYGLSEDYEEDIDVIMGTFSKAFGVQGGFVATSEEISQYLVNRSGGFVYSTAPSPMIVGACQVAWNLVPLLKKKREDLFAKSDYLRRELKKKGFDIGNSQHHIVPIMVGKDEKVMKIKKQLREKGILVAAIRPPTVSPNAARLRICVCSSHTYKEIENLINELGSLTM